MATPPILDDAAPGDAPDADADALLAWPEICDLMNLQAPDAWRPRHAAVLAVRRRARDEGGLDGRPPDLFSFLAKESRDLRSASARAALEALGDLLHAGAPPAEDADAVVASLLARATHELKFLAAAARRALHALATTGDPAALDAVVKHCAAGSKLWVCSMAWSFRVIDVTLSPCPRVGVEVHEGSKARKTLAAETATRLLAAGAEAPPGDARWTATLKAALQVATRDRAAATALLRALAPAPDRDAFAEASAAALGASDSSALVALRFPAKPKRAAGDRKRVPLRERMAATRGPAEL